MRFYGAQADTREFTSRWRRAAYLPCAVSLQAVLGVILGDLVDQLLEVADRIGVVVFHGDIERPQRLEDRPSRLSHLEEHLR